MTNKDKKDDLKIHWSIIDFIGGTHHAHWKLIRII